MMTETILRTEDLSIGYTAPRQPTHMVSEDLAVSLQRGELVCLIGPNGVGKSTLMRTIAGMHPPLAGRVLLMDDDVHKLPPYELARRLSIVLTEHANAGLLTGYELVALGRYPYTGWSGKLAPHDEAMVQWAIEAVGAAALAPRKVGELSDGERQKLMIARALAQDPVLMLLDEPTAYLDLPRRVEVMRLLRQLAHTTKRAVLLSTHDLDLALRSADRIWLMAHGGTLQTGAPEDLVLSGAFERAFHGEGVAFDMRSGSFRINERPSGEVVLVGEGIPALWTRRALEREGFTVLDAAANGHTQVHVLPGDEAARWRLTRNGSSQEHGSMYDLIAGLRHEER
jgi:iron complex transport system ATP-binding protein